MNIFANRDKKEIIGLTEALAASVLWGFGFIALRWSLDAFGPIWSRVFSFGLLAGVVLPFAFLKPRWRSSINWSQFLLAALPGLALGLTLCFQSAGLTTTTVAKSGFLTVSYVVLIPIGERLFYKQRLHAAHWFAVLQAVVGTMLMCGGVPTDWALGDLLTLICAVFAAGHFLLLQRVARRIESPFFFNALQVAWAGMITLPFALFWEKLPSEAPSLQAWLSLLFLTFGSIMIGFMLQVRAQRVLSSTITGLICLLEGPFAAMFGYLLLGEEMTVTQAIGATVVLAASVIAGLVPVPKG